MFAVWKGPVCLALAMSPLSDCRDTKVLNSKTMTACTTRPIHSQQEDLWAVGTEQDIYGTKDTFSCHFADLMKRNSQAHHACQGSCRSGSRQAFPSSAPQRDRPAMVGTVVLPTLLLPPVVPRTAGQWVLRSDPSLGIIHQTWSLPPEQTQWCLLLEEKPGRPSNGCF